MRLVWMVGVALWWAGCLSPMITLRQGAPSPLLVQNDSTLALCYVYLAPRAEGPVAADLDLGPDRLDPQNVIAPGEQHRFLIPEGHHHLRLEDCNHSVLIERRDLVVGPEGVTLTFHGHE